jgi:hypothetical protein
MEAKLPVTLDGDGGRHLGACTADPGKVRGSVRLPAEAEAWALSATTASERSNRRHLLGFWYRFLEGREATPALGDAFEAHTRSSSSALMAGRVLSAVRVFCRIQIAQGTMAVYPFPSDPSRPVPPEAERWLGRFANHRNRGYRRSYLRVWFGFLAGREASEELAADFAVELAAKSSEVMAYKIRGTVNSYLRASAVEAGLEPIVVRRHA